jgi:hypothetical protein
MKKTMNITFDELDRRTEICLECPKFILKDARCRQSGDFLIKYIDKSCPENRWDYVKQSGDLP